MSKFIYCLCGCGTLISPTRTDGRPKKFAHGHNRGNWRGGRITDSHGYVFIKLPDHPRSDKKGYIREHILIAETVFGKHLPEKAEVHHVDGIGENNMSHNLIICEDHEYHMLLHGRQKALKACGHANWLKCRFCKEYDAPENMRIYRNPKSTNPYGYHVECQNDYNRNRPERLLSVDTSDYE